MVPIKFKEPNSIIKSSGSYFVYHTFFILRTISNLISLKNTMRILNNYLATQAATYSSLVNLVHSSMYNIMPWNDKIWAWFHSLGSRENASFMSLHLLPFQHIGKFEPNSFHISKSNLFHCTIHWVPGNLVENQLHKSYWLKFLMDFFLIFQTLALLCTTLNFTIYPAPWIAVQGSEKKGKNP